METVHDNDSPLRRVMLINDSCFAKTNKGDNRPVFCHLRHPKTSQPAIFLFVNHDKELFEVVRFKEEFRSWFIGSTVQQDGSLYITTPVDPLFLILPFLINSTKNGKFAPLDQLVCDEGLPECRRLCHCAAASALSNVADVKDAGDLTVYRYNQEAALQWLTLKVAQVVEELKAKQINVTNSAQVATFINTDHEATDDQYNRYAHGLVSDYLPSALSEELHKHLGIKDLVHEKPSIAQPNAKRLKNANAGDIMPIEDYTAGNTQSKKTQVSKLTPAQKRLSKVDKGKMKNISSFFSTKATKKK